MVETQNTDLKLLLDELKRELRDELARIHTRIDEVSDELSRLVCDDCAEPFQILEKNTESRILQAYYKGLRYVFDLHSHDGQDGDPRNIH